MNTIHIPPLRSNSQQVSDDDLHLPRITWATNRAARLLPEVRVSLYFSAPIKLVTTTMSKIVRSIKNVANGYSSTQILVRKATSNDPSGPTTYDMEEVAAATYNTQTEFLEIMDMLDRRLNDKGKNWRHVAKSLTVLDYLVRFGSDKCVMWSKDNLYIIKTLREFVHFDEANNDQGALIRVKARELVSLLRDDERLTRERQMAKNKSLRPRRERSERPSDPYDADLQRALELSRETADRERSVAPSDETDADLQAALKLSLEEEEMRKLRGQPQVSANDNLLDLDEPVQYQPTYFQPQQTFVQPQYYQVDMFGNPVQQTAGFYANYGQFGQPQQYQTQIPQYTGFTEELKPLKTGSNNPFALQDSTQQPAFFTQPQPQSQPQFQQVSQQPQQAQQYQQQAQQYQQQTQQPALPQTQQQQPQTLALGQSKYNDSHELNTLLATGTGVDTFGNTGATRIPHQHTKTGTFINSSGTGIRNPINDIRLSSNATGNPFLNTGIGNTANATHSRIDAAPTGFGFGNSKDEPSLIDI